MEKNIWRTSMIVGSMFMVAALLISPLEAYDSHHPNPMAILNGHVSHSRPVVKKEIKEVNATKKIQPWRMYKRRKEGQYVIKPEPYSIGSKKSDPELLGPQRTIQTAETVAATAAPVPAAVTPPAPSAPKTPTVGMTRDACIGMIGQEKFDAYVQKYGGEKGALHRCLILKRLR